MKRREKVHRVGRFRWQKMERMARLCFILVCAFSFGLSAKTLAQQERVSLHLERVELKTVLEKIQEQTQVSFMLNREQSERLGMVSVKAENETLEAVLDRLLGNSPLMYVFMDRVIVIKERSVMRQIDGKEVRGTVTDEKGNPLPGVTVMLKGTSLGVITDVEGKYTLRLPQEFKELKLIFSFVGMKMQEMAYAGQTELNVTMHEEAAEMDEVVIIGYGSSKKKDLTGSVATVKTEELKNLPALTVDDAMAGKAAGVQVTKADGSPGGAVRIRIRGGSSLKGNVDPLYVIDGIPQEIKNNYISSSEIVNPLEAANYGDDFNNSVSGSFMRGLNSLSGLSVSDIESISILKDASATAIYGSKAANGVVIITTKRGRRDMKPQFNVNYNVGVSTPQREKVLNGEQYISTMIAAIEQSNANMADNIALQPNLAQNFQSRLNSNGEQIQFLKGLDNADTDWVDLVTKTGVSHNVDFSVAGGSRHSRYYTSFSYSNQEGTLINTDFERYTLKTNLDNDIAKRFRMGTNLAFGYSKNNITNGVYSQAMSAPPVLSPYNADGSYANYSQIPELAKSYMGFQNPLAVASGINQAKTYDFKGSMYGELDIWEGLKFKSTMSLSYVNYNQLNYVPSYVMVGGYYGVSDSEGGQNTQSQSVATGTFFENTLTYNKVFNENHRIDAILGTSWEKQGSSFFSATGKGFPDDTHLNNLGSAQVATSVAGANPSTQSSLLSFYIRANYVLKDRYLFTFTGRSDNSSKFSKDNRVGYFPSGAIAWRISEESFLKDVAWIDELKLRASMGKTGTQSIADHMFRTLYSPGSYAGSTALYPSQLGNEDIKWESTVQKDLGLDFSFFEGRLGGTMAYYHKVTDGALLSITPAPSSGFNTIVSNIAKVKNIGVEFELNGDFIRTKNWKWSGALNISHNSSKVLKLQGDNFSSDTGRGELNLGTTVYREGKSLGLLCGRKVERIIRTQEQLEDYKSRFSSWSRMYPDLGIGSVELALDETGFYYEDVIGNCTPDFYGGFTTTLQYKNLALLANFTFSYGNDLIYQKDVTDMNFNSYANRGVRVLEGSTPEHPTERPTVLYNSFNFLTNLNVYDASYLKLQSLSLSYSLPDRYAKKLRMSGLSVYGTASNVFTLTSYPGPDPAVSDDPYSVAGGGRDVTSYPTVRSYTFGIRLSF